MAIPNDRELISNEEFQNRITACEMDVLGRLRCVEGGFNEEKYGPYIGLGNLKKYLQSELDKRYKEAAPATLALLEQRCREVSMDLARLDSKLEAAKDVSQLRKSAVLLADSMCTHLVYNPTYLNSLLVLLNIDLLELIDVCFVYHSTHYLMEQMILVRRYGGTPRWRNN